MNATRKRQPAMMAMLLMLLMLLREGSALSWAAWTRGVQDGAGGAVQQGGDR
eukprot:COSAG02_NODE_1469_length_12459_cov_25.847896_1_plen_52_part_00